ncbi:hypothetical protein CEQ31_014415 [Serratia odorifera]|jgi:hypothetical protein|nr:hypothetical protein CEQ31_014415 [Serratia odorifera]RII71925.1 hypothetical protein DX901_11940 [Serratia odorifera]
MFNIMPTRHKQTIKNKKLYIALEVMTFLLSIPLGYLCSQIDSLNDITLGIILIYIPVSMITVDYLYQRFERK